MARLPIPGGDDGDWGDILNEFLEESHNSDGTVKDSAVSEAAIADGSITTAKLADDAVDTAQIADDAVDTAQIADDAVTTAKIADGDITTAKLATGDPLVYPFSGWNTASASNVYTSLDVAYSGTGYLSPAQVPSWVTIDGSDNFVFNEAGVYQLNFYIMITLAGATDTAYVVIRCDNPFNYLVLTGMPNTGQTNKFYQASLTLIATSDNSLTTALGGIASAVAVEVGTSWQLVAGAIFSGGGNRTVSISGSVYKLV